MILICISMVRKLEEKCLTVMKPLKSMRVLSEKCEIRHCWNILAIVYLKHGFFQLNKKVIEK